ncbi:UNVERIFIED_CONTAM: hypothetical protein RMT77_011916 [Armadillidium vulgare]
MASRNGTISVLQLPKKEETPTDVEELDPEEGDGRETWGNQCEFFLSCLGYAVGFGNVWRFPYLCYKNGGAVFLIPYATMLFCAGLPLFFLELALGQYVSLGPNILFHKIAPITAGLGWAMIIVSTLVAIYYNMILAWTFFYTFASFTGTLPWGHCNNEFNSIGCFTNDDAEACALNGTFYYDKQCMDVESFCNIFNATEYLDENTNLTCQFYTNTSSPDDLKKVDKLAQRISASEDYFKNRMLGVTGTTWEDMGGLSWELVGCLALAWVIVCLCMIKGVKSSGKVVYFTALFPYAVLLILFIRGITLEGAYKGIEFYIMKPNVTKLMEVEVWNDAATQIFYSLGSSFGGLITLASYNKFKNNCMRDAIIIALCNCSTSVFAGFVIFSILGFMATQLGKEVADVVSSGSGLAFVAYPEAVTKMPFPPLWALLFFFMLITLGLDSQFTMVETITTAIFDQYESLRRKKPIIVCLMCFILFLCGLTMCLRGGIYMFELFNNYTAGLSVVLLAITEICVVQYVYGFKNIMRHIAEMDVSVPKFLYAYWAVTWMFITPASLLIILGFSIKFMVPTSFDGYLFPKSIQGLGWLLTCCSLILIPIFAAWQIYLNRSRGEPWRKLITAHEDFCPASIRRLRALKGAATKGQAEGIYRYVKDNEAFDDGRVVKIYPKIGHRDNSGLEGHSNGGDRPPPYSSEYM